MMLFLAANVTDDVGHIPAADGKGGVRAAPLEGAPKSELMIGQMRRRAFELLDEKAGGNGRGHFEQQMYMIGHSAYGQYWTVVMNRAGGQTIVQHGFFIRRNERQSIPCCPNEMRVKDDFVVLHGVKSNSRVAGE